MSYDNDEQDEKPSDIKNIKKWASETNLCEFLDEEELEKFGHKVVEWYDDDEESRSEWKKRNDTYLKLSTQVMEKKSYPWPNAANVKYPLLTTAAMQFAARAYPALVPGPSLVTGLVIGEDQGGVKQQTAQRVGHHMSYQLMYEMPGWEEDMDKLCLILPIIGCVFKKTYYDGLKKQNCSELVFPNDLVIDYYAKSLDTATRVSHVVYLNKNQVRERVNRGLFCDDVDLGDTQVISEANNAKDKIDGTSEPKVTPATPYKFIECHCFWDTDGDGYDEPYIVTVHYHTRKVVRVVARYDEEGIELDTDEKGKEKLIKIEPLQYFTKFGFIPNPDGSIYDLGFGLLLGGVNETINTLTNQLLDAGTLSNLQSGFLGRGIRIRSGQGKFQPGEWKPVDFTGDDIKKHIYPLPANEPSDVLFKLLETLVTSGKELASVAEIFVGKMPGQNTPATTTMATIEQGLKVFTAIYKRIYRALGKEYEKLFRLNSIHMDDKVYFTVNALQGPQGQQAYKTDYDPDTIAIKPNADPNIVSSAQKLMKVQAMGPLLALQTLNPQEYTKRFLEAIEAENIQALMNTQPKPDPEAQKMQMEMKQSQQESQQKMQIEQMKASLKQQEMEMKLQFEQIKLQMDQQKHQMDLQAHHQETQQEMQLNQQQAEQEMAITQQTGQMDMQLAKKQHTQSMEQGDAQHKQKMQQAKQTAAAKPKEGASKK